MPRHILIRLTKTKHKERILKAVNQKQQIIYKGNSIHLTADLSAETLQARREWQGIFKVLKGKSLQPRLPYPASISFKIDGEIKSFQTSKSSENSAPPNQLYNKCSVQFSSVTQSCPTLCNPMNRNTPGLPVHHHLLEFIQTHVHRVRDVIQPFHPRSSPSLPAPNPSQHQSLFQ